jgi:hypothetical protein
MRTLLCEALCWCKTDLLSVDILDGLPNIIYGNDREKGAKKFASFDRISV